MLKLCHKLVFVDKKSFGAYLELPVRQRSMSKKAVFLDRDGTLNDDPGYLSRPEQMVLLPGVGEGLRLLKDAGYFLVVVSNQSGVGRGLIPEGALSKIHQRLQDLLAPFGTRIDHFELCFHRPEQECECRKPKPKLILDTARHFEIDLTQSYMVGDKISDIEAGKNAGCKGSLLVRTGEGRNTEKKGNGTLVPLYVGDSLIDVAKWLLADHDLIT